MSRQVHGGEVKSRPLAADASHFDFRGPGHLGGVRGSSLHQLLAFKGLPIDVLLLLAYISLSRSYIGDESTLGVKIGPMPLYVTDATLLVLIAISVHKRGGRLLNWVFGGGGAGEIGRAVWLLFLISVVYFALAFPHYHLLAIRDLAIFGYSIFFPLTYFAIPHRVMAAKLVRYFTYATCIGAALFEFQSFSGIKLFSLTQTTMALYGGAEISRLTADNLGAFLGQALAALFVYLVVERKHRLFHASAMLLCLATLLQLLDRSALLAFSIGVALFVILGVGRSRAYAVALGAGLFALLLLSAQGELPIPGGAKLHSVWQGLSSAANFQNDPDGQFRWRRWQSTAGVWMTSPVFGVGFGAPIMLDTWGVRSGVRAVTWRGGLAAFNAGMPHNSFLVVLARTGVIGFGLICFAWARGLIAAIKGTRGRRVDPDRLAIAGALIAMIPIAALNLFFERPMLCAPFWIMLAVSYRLSETVPAQTAKSLKMTTLHPVMTFSRRQPVYSDPGVRGNHEIGGWQARWK